jgi:hypothetical protein
MGDKQAFGSGSSFAMIAELVVGRWVHDVLFIASKPIRSSNLFLTMHHQFTPVSN